MARVLDTSASTPFVGRVRELAQIRQALARARGGAGSVVLVTGEPGIGKTRLVEEAFGGHRGPLAWGLCAAGDGAPAFRPWIDVVRRITDRPVFPAWGDAAEEVRPSADARPDRGTSAEVSRFRLFERVTDVLTAVSGDDPAVVVLDDLHRADEDSVRLLQFVGAEVRRLPCLVVGTYRDTDLDPEGPLATALADLARAGPQLQLAGLSPTEIGHLATAVLAAEGSGGGEVLPGSELHSRTGGNPYFARELLRLTEADGLLRAPRGSTPLPGGVRAVVHRRLARLPQPTYDLLSWAAVTGPTFEVDLVAAAASLPVAGVLAAMDPAVDARMVVPVDEQRLAFAHDLVRETLLGSMGLAGRSARHWALGCALAAVAGEDHERVTRAAAHLVAGVTAGDVATAVSWAVRAAERSRSMLAYDDAAAWYARAVATRRRAVAGDEGEGRLLLELGAARLDAGRPQKAREAYLAAAELARTRGDGEQLADAALGLGAGLPGIEVPLFDQVQIDLLEEGLAALPGTDSSRRVWVLARLSVALAFVADHDRRRRLSEEAAEMARRLGDEVGRAYALVAWCDAMSGPDDVKRRLDVARDVTRVADAAQLRPLALLARRFQVVALLELGRLAEAAVEVERFHRIAEGLRRPLYLWYAPLWRGTLAMASGDLQEAARWTAEAERVGASAQSENARVLVAVQRFVALRHERRFDQAAALAAELMADAPGVAAPESLVGSLVMADVVTGHSDRARRRADAIVAQGLRAPRADSEWLPDLAQLADAAIALRHHGLAALVHDALQPYASLFVVEGIGAAVCGSVAHYLAGLSALLGRGSDAAGLADVATRLHHGAGLVVEPPPLVPGAAAPAQQPADGQAMLRREGETWALRYEGTTVRVRDSKGMRDLAVLLRAPGRAVHVCELVGMPVTATAEDLDATAVGAYRRRLADIDKDLGGADAGGDVGRAAALQAEHDFITAELASALGLGGRPRRSGDPVERARKAVSARIRESIARIGVHHPGLERHLTRSVRTGTWCAYSPERPVRWRG